MQTTHSQKNQKNRFHILIRGRNCEKYLERCINSIRKQTYKNWDAFIVLDNPQDKSIKIAEKLAFDHSRISVAINHKRMGLAYNIWKGFKTYECHNKQKKSLPDFNENDICCTIDADDSIILNALEIVNSTYNKQNEILATHGSYIKMSKRRKTKVSKPYPKNVKVRKYHWRGSHLKTFRWKLFKKLTQECFKDSNDNWLPAASDLALMIPIIELAGLDRVKHIKTPIYLWYDNTPYKTNYKVQRVCEKIIRNKQPFERIT